MKTASLILLLSISISALADTAFEANVSHVSRLPMDRKIKVSAEVKSKGNVTLHSELKGRIVYLAQQGERVQQGDIVLKLEDDLLRLELAEQKALLVKEQSRLAKFKLTYQKNLQLSKEKYVSEQVIEWDLKDLKMAEQDISIAGYRVKILERQLSKTTVRAPASGVIYEQNFNLNEWVDEGDAVLGLINTDNLEVVAKLPTQYINQISVDDEVLIDNQGTDVKGTVHSVIPYSDPKTQTIAIIIKPQGGSSLVAGSRLMAQLSIAREPELTVPRTALVLKKQGQPSIYKVSDDCLVHNVPIKIIEEGDNNLLQVDGNIEDGDLILVWPFNQVSEGQKVKLKGQDKCIG